MLYNSSSESPRKALILICLLKRAKTRKYLQITWFKWRGINMLGRASLKIIDGKATPKYAFYSLCEVKQCGILAKSCVGPNL